MALSDPTEANFSTNYCHSAIDVDWHKLKNRSIHLQNARMNDEPVPVAAQSKA